MIRFSFIALFILGILVAGCSSQKEVTIVEKRFMDEKEKDKLVLEHFLNGANAEAKGNFDLAVREFGLALEVKQDAGIHFVIARNYYYLNKLSLALEHSRTAVHMNPEMAEYKMLLSDIYTAANMIDSAAFVLEEITAKDSSRIPAFYKLARLHENKKPLKAIEIYNHITDIVGPEWSIMLHIAELYEKMGNLEESAIAIEKLLSLDPSNITVQKMLSELYTRSKQFDKALLILQDIIELTPDDLDARERRAAVFIEQGEWAMAAEEYRYIVSEENVPLDTKIRIGVSYFNKSLSDSSVTPIAKDFFQSIDNDTVDWRVKMYLGAIALNEGDDSGAIKIFKEVTEIATWNPDAWVQLGGLYFDNRRYDEAVTLMQQAIESFPENFAINLILGLSLAQSERNIESKPYLKKAVELNPLDINAVSAYAFTLSQLKENQEAEEYLKKALVISPDDVNLLGTLGLIYDSEERWSECDSVYERALQIDSLNALVNNNYAYSLSEREEQLDRALGMAVIAVTAEPENSSYLDTIGWIYFKMGNYVLAKDYIEKAIEIGGEKPVMLEHLGDIVFKKGEKNYAMELWEKAYKLDESNIKLKEKIEKGEI